MPSVVRLDFLEVVRVDALGVAAAAIEVSALVQLPAMPCLPRYASGLQGAVLLGDGRGDLGRASLVEGADPEQTAAGRIVLGLLVQVLSKLGVLPSREGVGSCVRIGDGMTPCRDSRSETRRESLQASGR